MVGSAATREDFLFLHPPPACFIFAQENEKTAVFYPRATRDVEVSVGFYNVSYQLRNTKGASLP